MPHDVRVEWRGEEAQRKVDAMAVALLRQAGMLIVGRAKQLLSVPGTGRAKGKKAGPVTHAPPGQPPYKQTGRGRASVTYEVDEKALVMRAGTNVDYMRHLELGTRRGIRPHPWLRRAVAEVRAQLEALMAGLGRLLS